MEARKTPTPALPRWCGGQRVKGGVVPSRDDNVKSGLAGRARRLTALIFLGLHAAARRGAGASGGRRRGRQPRRGQRRRRTRLEGRLAGAARIVVGAAPGRSAIKDYDEAIRISPNARAAFNNRGNVYMTKRQYERALKDYDEAVRLGPDQALYISNRGNALRVVGHRAIGDYRQALTLQLDAPTKQRIETAQGAWRSELIKACRTARRSRTAAARPPGCSPWRRSPAAFARCARHCAW